MTQEEFESLNIGDIIKPKSSNRTYVVVANYGNRVTAVATVDITNPVEYTLIAKANYD